MSKAPEVRELFIEELTEIRGGARPLGDPCCSTEACCEEGPFGCCTILDLDDIIRP